MPPTRIHDHFLTSQRLHGYSFFCCITIPGEPPHTHLLYPFFRFFSVTPHPLSSGSRHLQDTWSSVVYCLYFVFFLSCARFIPLYPPIINQLSSLVFHVQYALLDDFLYSPYPPSYLLPPFTRPDLDTLERPIRMTLAFLEPPSLLSYHSHNFPCLLRRRFFAMKNT